MKKITKASTIEASLTFYNVFLLFTIHRNVKLLIDHNWLFAFNIKCCGADNL